MLPIDFDTNEAASEDRGAKANRSDEASDTRGIVHSASGLGSQGQALGDNSGTATTFVKSVHFSRKAIKRSKYHLKFPSLNVMQPRSTSFVFTAKSLDLACIVRYDETKALRAAWRLHKSLYGGSGDIWEDNELKNTFFVTQIAGREPSAKIRVATDCSGMETPIQAFDNLGIPYDHVFASDVDVNAKKFIQSNFKPRTFYDDMTHRDHVKACTERHYQGRGAKANRKNESKSFVPLDFYITGFPCQPFSVAGYQQGFSDDKGRGKIVHHVIQFIEETLPSVFILENVKGFSTIENGTYAKEVVEALRSIDLSGVAGREPSAETRETNHVPAYDVYTHIMNTKHHGLPHHRARW